MTYLRVFEAPGRSPERTLREALGEIPQKSPTRTSGLFKETLGEGFVETPWRQSCKTASNKFLRFMKKLFEFLLWRVL